MGVTMTTILNKLTKKIILKGLALCLLAITLGCSTQSSVAPTVPTVSTIVVDYTSAENINNIRINGVLVNSLISGSRYETAISSPNSFAALPRIDIPLGEIVITDSQSHVSVIVK